MVTDCFNPKTGYWGGYGLGSLKVPNNHYGMGGENVAFADGHVEWRRATLNAAGNAMAPTSQVQFRFEFWNQGWSVASW
jgi:prepilin-type processing-associated H-X9-DG protein